MEVKRNGKKARAALVAGTLAGAIALTGTLAWINMTQGMLNEALADKNPGGRIHDDFDGVNKDVYAENFTDNDTGTPIFARIRLLEYMETGEDAGVNRTVTDDSTGEQVTNPDRKVTVTKYINAAGETVEPDINDYSTWYIHKPETDTETDPFHDYWQWDTGGQTVYMPTFNKNKDSISPEVNGTYLGPNGEFDADDAYTDNVIYTDGQTLTADAYYDADGDTIDENYGKNGDQPFDGIPGAGGDKKAEGVEDPDYEVINEEHTAHATLNGLGVITMKEWKDAGSPVCNKWVWDEDGWFYWPEPILPQTATGLLLDKISQGGVGEKCYYAIRVEGQFADSSKASWGEPNTAAEGTESNATGFYIDGFSDNAKALLEQACQVIVVKGEGDAPDKWYLPIEANVFKRIADDEGTLSDPICAGPDKNPGTADDLEGVIYVEGEGVKVGETNYGNWFLASTTAQPYYRTVGNDGKLGTADDARLWTTGGNTFPAGVVDEVADAVTVAAPEGMTELEPGKIETEVGATLAKPFQASVQLNDAAAESQEVTWSVVAANGSELAGKTAIGVDTGILTVDPDETASELIVTANSKLDDRVFGTYRVKVYGKPNVKLIDVSTGKPLESIQAGTPMKVKAWLYRGEEQVETALQPETFTWGEASLTTRAIEADACILEPDAEDSRQATITVGRGTSGESVIFTVGCDRVDPPTGFAIPITAPELITVSVTGNKTAVEAGQSLTFTAAFSKPGVLNDETVTWKAFGVDGSELTTGLELTPGETGATMTLKVLDTFVLSENNATITVKATPNDPTVSYAAAAAGETTFTIIPPTSITVTPEVGGVTIGKTLNMSATVLNADDLAYAAGNVSWFAGDAEGNVITGVNIDQNGVLSVGTNVKLDTQITVTAASTVKPDVTKSAVITADVAIYYDGVPYYVLYTDTANNRQLILTKYIIDTQVFRNGDAKGEEYVYWPDSDIRAYLLTWLESKPELKAALWKDTGTDQYMTFHIRKAIYLNEWFDSNDPIFLLSKADIDGSISIQNKTGEEPATIDPKDYTVVKDGAGVVLNTPTKNWKAKVEGATEFADWWLRSPGGHTTTYCADRVNDSGKATLSSSNKVYISMGVRPACWVKIN